MKIVFINVWLIDLIMDSDLQGSFFVQDGVIVDIGVDIVVFDDVEVVDCQGLCLVSGIVDIGVKVCESGECYKESYCFVGLVVVVGGVMMIVMWFDMIFVIDMFEILEFVIWCVNEVVFVNVVFMVVLIKDCVGCEMMEIGFFMDVGVVVFIDCDYVVVDIKVFFCVLIYV